MKIKIFQKISISVFTLSLFFLCYPVQAQEAQSYQTDGEVASLATVNIYRTQVIKQEGNKITIAFDISNREGVQPAIRYAVDLVDINNNEQTIVDEKVYDETVSLGENETVHKEIQYTAPAYLKGTYQIWVESQREEGTVLGQGFAKQEVILNGNGQFVNLDSKSCYLDVANESKNPHYTLDQGVDVAKTEELVLNCKAKNNFPADQAVTPSFNTYFRTSFGKLISSQKVQALSLKAGEEKQLSFSIPKANDPQAYNVAFQLLDSKNQPISNQVIFHYVIQGPSATIQNLTLDKDYYQKGDTANLSFFWSSSADDFPGSRAKGTLLSKTSIEVKMENSQNEPCIDPITTQDTNLKLAIKNSCIDPKVTVALKDQNGKVLSQSVLALKSKNIPASANGNFMAGKVTKNKVIAITAILTLLLIIIIISYYFKKKQDRNLMKTLIIFLLLGTGIMFGSLNAAQADTTTWFIPNIYGDGQTGRVVDFIYNPENSRYLPGQTMAITGREYYDNCSNAYTAAKMTATINGQTTTLASHSAVGAGSAAHAYTKWKTATGSVETRPGLYNVTISLSGSYQNFHDEAIKCHASPCYLKDCLDIKNQADYKSCVNAAAEKGATRLIPYEVLAKLDITKAGTGTGTINSTIPGYDYSFDPNGNTVRAINCGSVCSLYFDPIKNVTLTAAPDAGSTFVGWGGACSGTGNCTINMNDNRTVTATFNSSGDPVVKNTLSVIKKGDCAGTVVSNPSGINCGSACSASYSPTDSVSLVASGNSADCVVDKWEGCLDGKCGFMSTNKIATVTFKKSTFPECTPKCECAKDTCDGEKCIDADCKTQCTGTKSCPPGGSEGGGNWHEVAP